MGVPANLVIDQRHQSGENGWVHITPIRVNRKNRNYKKKISMVACKHWHWANRGWIYWFYSVSMTASNSINVANQDKASLSGFAVGFDFMWVSNNLEYVQLRGGLFALSKGGQTNRGFPTDALNGLN